ncbi:MAG: ComF family protein [Candidatus Omnitrophota bacterium]
MHMLSRLMNGLVDILYPKKCLACKEKINSTTTNDFVCLQCWGNIKKNIPPFCHSCGRHLNTKVSTKSICNICIKEPLFFDRAFCPCAYEGTIKKLIHEFKYKNKDYLGKVLSTLMIDFIKEYNLGIEYMDIIIPIPLHNARLREREFNQAQVLGNFIAGAFNKDISTDTLVRTQPTKSQTELKGLERFLNVAGSFSLSRRNPVNGKNILLIDDVLTTGATASEAARVLKNSGAGIVFVLTLAN